MFRNPRNNGLWLIGLIASSLSAADATTGAAYAQSTSVSSTPASPVTMTTMQRYAYHDSIAAASRKAGKGVRATPPVVMRLDKLR